MEMTKTWFITETSAGIGRLLTKRLLERNDRAVATLRHDGALNDLKARHGEIARQIGTNSTGPIRLIGAVLPYFKMDWVRHMKTIKLSLSILAAGLIFATTSAEAQSPNKVLGTWRMITAQLDPESRNVPAYGSKPESLLVFTEDMHVMEVLTDSTVPKFASKARGQGTPEENQAAIAGSIGWFGTYTVDENGELSGDIVEGSTFPNWVGDVRTRKDIQIVVDGDHMLETFFRPEGTKIVITWQRIPLRRLPGSPD
jgi:hypothetical protein